MRPCSDLARLTWECELGGCFKIVLFPDGSRKASAKLDSVKGVMVFLVDDTNLNDNARIWK